ncbi:MAG: beta-ketoacyl synthase N-terminal-like domain-containing protein [Chitinispirillia bacterium]
MKSIVIEQAQIISPLGNLTDTVNSLISGSDAIGHGPCFDIPVGCASFKDEKFRDFIYCFKHLLLSINLQKIDFSSTLLIYCSAKGDIRLLEEQIYFKKSHSSISPRLDIQCRKICELIGMDPFSSVVVSNACTSGSIGIEMAVDLLRMQRYSHIIVCGFDCLSRFTTTGFYSLGALSKDRARPFDSKRDGLTMGEGGGIAVLSLKNPCKGEIAVMGAGSSNDANHRTGPSRTGEGLYKAIKAALSNGSITYGSIGAVKCHGTATPYNDAMEAKALHLLFGQKIPPCVSYKGAIGHMSGAGSLVETLIAAENLKRRKLPPTKGFFKRGVDEEIPVSSNSQSFAKPCILCLSAGFGGLNSAVIIKEYT